MVLVLGVSKVEALLIAVGIMVLTASISTLSGLWGVLWTDLFQFVLKMGMVVVLAWYAVRAVGGMGGLGGGMGGMMSGMGGMMMQVWGGKSIGEPTADMPVNLYQARKNAQAYLDARKSGLTIEEDTDVFYGYYTVHTVDKDGNTVGMLSVNGYTGQVWNHIWQGTFIVRQK